MHAFSLVPRLSPSTRAIYVRIINAYVNCARGGGEPGNEANACYLQLPHKIVRELRRELDMRINFKQGDDCIKACSEYY